MQQKRKGRAARLIAHTLQTFAVLGIALVTVAACGGPSIKCDQFTVTLCGENGVQVTACGSVSKGEALSRDNISLYLDKPPDYMDVAPMYAKAGLLQFPPGLTLDASFQPAVQSQPASIDPAVTASVTPESYGYGVYAPADAVGGITWKDKGGSGQGAGVAIDHFQRVIVTSAHTLLGPKEDAGTDISQRVYTFDNRTYPYDPSHLKGWGFVHPMYDPDSRAYDVGIVVIGDLTSSGSTRSRTYYQLGVDPKIDSVLHCTCPLEEYYGIVRSYGPGNKQSQRVGTCPSCVQPPNPFLDKSANFPKGFNSEYEMESQLQIFAYDSLQLDDDSRPPTIDTWSLALWGGDNGAPMWTALTDPPYGASPAAHALWGIYSGPSTVQTRRFTRVTTATVEWVQDMLENGRASYPPLNWNGLGDHTTDNAYAFVESGDFGSRPTSSLPPDLTCDPAPGPLPKISVNDISQIVILGDSLSDQQNQWQKTLANGDASFYTPAPGNGYWNGRFTNGYNWVDYFSQDYPGVKVVNLAVGGAFASTLGQSSLGSGLGAIEKKVRPTLLQEYAGGSFDDQTLAVIMIGGNDVYEVTKRLAANGTSPNNITADGLAAAIVAGVKGVVDQLKQQHVKRFIFGALPPIAVTPASGAGKGAPSWGLGSDPKAIAFAQTVVGRANSGIRLIANALTETGLYAAGYVDITSFLGSWQDPSGTFDLGAYPRPVENVGMFEMKEACADQDSFQISPFHGYTDKPCRGYMFFDNLHPTTLSHCLLSQFFEANGFSGAGIDDVHIPAGPSGTAMSPQDLFLACETRAQNEAYSAPTWFTSPYKDPRHTRFYYQSSSPMDWSSTTCSNTCPTGYLWDDGGTDLVESPTPYDEPGWYDILSGFTSSGITGPGNGALAKGWLQPKSGWPSGARGACRCAPLNDGKGVTCGGGPCASPSDIARVMNNVGAAGCRTAMFWSGYNGPDYRFNVKNDAMNLAKSVGAETLEGTLASLKMPDLASGEVGEYQSLLWDYASMMFADNACPDNLYVAFGGSLRSDNIWRKTECPLAVIRNTKTAKYFLVANLPGDDTVANPTTPIECNLKCDAVPSGLDTSGPTGADPRCPPMLKISDPPAPGQTNQE